MLNFISHDMLWDVVDLVQVANSFLVLSLESTICRVDQFKGTVLTKKNRGYFLIAKSI